MRKSIGSKLISSFLLVVLITVAIIVIALVTSFKSFYYKNVENTLMNKLEVSVDFFNRYYSNYNLNNLILEDTDLLWGHVDAEIQVLDTEGNILMDSVGVIHDGPITSLDVTNALSGTVGTWTGSVDYADENVLSVAAPLKNERGDIIGVLRFISSLVYANEALFKAGFTIIWMGILVLIISTIVSFLIAGSIVKPVKELTDVAGKMADGQYTIRSEIDTEDEFGQLAATLNTMAQEIIKREQIKNDFISSVSHELRTPLTSIKGWANVLREIEEGEGEILKEGLNIIENESDRLSKMVEELLDFSRFISGRIHLKKEKFDIVDTCKNVVRQLEPRAANAALDFTMDLEDEPVVLIGDEDRIRQLLINLLDNAIKFTSDNGWVKLKAYREDDCFQILISDNGMGIEKSELLRVKEKFYKGKHSKSHSGIGLSISDEIAKLHNGDLEIISELGVGTTVKVTLPIVSEEEV